MLSDSLRKRLDPLVNGPLWSVFCEYLDYKKEELDKSFRATEANNLQLHQGKAQLLYELYTLQDKLNSLPDLK